MKKIVKAIILVLPLAGLYLPIRMITDMSPPHMWTSMLGNLALVGVLVFLFTHSLIGFLDDPLEEENKQMKEQNRRLRRILSEAANKIDEAQRIVLRHSQQPHDPDEPIREVLHRLHSDMTALYYPISSAYQNLLSSLPEDERPS